VSVCVIVAGGPAGRRWLARFGALVREATGTVRRIGPGAVAGTSALSVASLLARIAVLPVLALSLPDAPSTGALALASFVLLYAQVAMPIPAGGGLVELAFLSGGVGIAHGAVAMLAGWRIHLTIIPAIAGVTVGGLVYGRSAWNALPFARRPVDATS
jgi:uncharacterized membrane protein YbhN (UPF0104 family)